jgi:hypothetical protein
MTGGAPVLPFRNNGGLGGSRRVSALSEIEGPGG